jgi:hypothetical protein
MCAQDLLCKTCKKKKCINCIHLPKHLDLIDHLLDIDMGALYKQLHGLNKFSVLPLLGMCYLGNNLASSYNERVNSAGKLIMGNGRTLLGRRHLEMCVVLRMNRDFMAYMAEMFPEIATHLVSKKTDLLYKIILQQAGL